MPFGRMGVKGLVDKQPGLKDRLTEEQSVKDVEKIDRKEFLKKLEASWYPYIRKTANIEEEIVKAKERIYQPGPFKKAWDKFNLTDEELRTILTSIVARKPDQVVNTVKVNRNAPCPCGSGKKYKKCCLGKRDES